MFHISEYSLENNLDKIENALTNAAKYPVILPGVCKVVMGAGQALASTIVGLISLPFKPFQKESQLTERCWVHLQHGLGNMLAGTLEAIPGVGTLCYRYRQQCGEKSRTTVLELPDSKLKKDNPHYDVVVNLENEFKFMPYTEVVKKELSFTKYLSKPLDYTFGELRRLFQIKVLKEKPITIAKIKTIADQCIANPDTNPMTVLETLSFEDKIRFCTKNTSYFADVLDDISRTNDTNRTESFAVALAVWVLSDKCRSIHERLKPEWRKFLQNNFDSVKQTLEKFNITAKLDGQELSLKVLQAPRCYVSELEEIVQPRARPDFIVRLGEEEEKRLVSKLPSGYSEYDVEVVYGEFKFKPYPEVVETNVIFYKSSYGSRVDRSFGELQMLFQLKVLKEKPTTVTQIKTIVAECIAKPLHNPLPVLETLSFEDKIRFCTKYASYFANVLYDISRTNDTNRTESFAVALAVWVLSDKCRRIYERLMPEWSKFLQNNFDSIKQTLEKFNIAAKLDGQELSFKVLQAPRCYVSELEDLREPGTLVDITVRLNEEEKKWF